MAKPIIVKSQDWLDRQLVKDEHKAAAQCELATRNGSSGSAKKWYRRTELLAELQNDLRDRPWAALEIAQRWQDVTRGGLIRRPREVFLDWDPPNPPGVDGRLATWDETMTEQLRQLIEGRWTSLGLLDIQRTELTERQADRLIWELLDTQIQYRHPPRERKVLKALRTPTRCAVTLGFTATDEDDQAQSYRFTFVAQAATLEAVDAEPKWMAQAPQWGNLVDDEATMPESAEGSVPDPVESFLPDDLRDEHDEVLAKIDAVRDLIATSGQRAGLSASLVGDELDRLESTLDDSLRLYRRIGADDQVMPLTGRSVHDEMAHQLVLMSRHVDRLQAQTLEPDVNAFAANGVYLGQHDA